MNQKRNRHVFRLTINALFAGLLSGATAMLWIVKTVDATGNLSSFLNVLRQQNDWQYAFAIACLIVAIFIGGGGGSISGGTRSNVLPDPEPA